MRNNYLYDKIDNCLLCNDAQIHKNEIAKIIRRLGWDTLANKIDDAFPVVICKKNGKFVANPMKRPGWCERGPDKP